MFYNITDTLVLDEKELEFRFIHASGPGGQNVNKVSTSVQLRFNVTKTESLPQNVKVRLMGMAGKKLNKEGEIVIEAKRFRSQDRNRQDAINRLIKFIQSAATESKPRLRTRPTAASIERRLKRKHHRGTIKRMRKTTVENFDEI